tara:strand:- start:374 stop:601 length:228 start_codon:yes stop_codon:yes gene_type:complete
MALEETYRSKGQWPTMKGKKMTAKKINIPQAVFEAETARSAIKAGHEEACGALDRQSVSQIPKSDPNHPMYSVSA